MHPKNLDPIKKALGKAAADLIQNNMIVGLGTGSTAHYFIESLSQKCQNGLKVRAVATSCESMLMATRLGIPMLSSEQTPHIDITVDGADEIDPQKRMIKGAGGALLREKIIASMSHEMVVIVDESKLVPVLGKKKFPVEIIPFAYLSTLHKMEKLGYKGSIRKSTNGLFFITDNGNFIVDLELSSSQTPQKAHEEVRLLPAVVETGFFEHFAGRVIVGFFDGQIVTRS